MRITIDHGTGFYYIASKTLTRGQTVFEGRLENAPYLAKRFSALSTTSTPLSLTLVVRNDDGFIPFDKNLWGKLVAIETDNNYTWKGHISGYTFDGSGKINIAVTEKSLPELTQFLPDEVASLSFIDENMHHSSLLMTVPIAIGGTVASPIILKCILIDKTQGIYLACKGEIHQIAEVYLGTEKITEGFTTYTGAAGQAEYAGFAYIQLDEDLRKNEDGSYAEIGVGVVGLKLGTHTIEECRNGARFLYHLLTNDDWGLELTDFDCDLNSFSAAISAVDSSGLKLDGIIYNRLQAQVWIDQICKVIRGTYDFDYHNSYYGQRTLLIDGPGTSQKTYTKNNIKLLRHGKGVYTGQVYNKGRLEFDYNPITGQFLQQVNYEDSSSISEIGEQIFYGQSYLIKDMDTAQAVLEYNIKKSLSSANKVLFETLELPEKPRKGQLITIDNPEKNLSGLWVIRDFVVGDFKHQVDVEKYDGNIFTFGPGGTKIDWSYEQPIASPYTPAAPTGLDLDAEVRTSEDGTSISVIIGSFNLPESKGYIGAAVSYGEGINPAAWDSLGIIQGNRFELKPLKAGVLYSVKIQMVSSTGKSTYLTATKTAAGDLTPPGVPSVSGAGYLKTIKLNISLSNPPATLAGFEIYRSLTPLSSEATYKSTVSSKDGNAQWVDLEADYNQNYYYFVKSVTTWKIKSAFPAACGPIKTNPVMDSDTLASMTQGMVLNSDPCFEDESAWATLGGAGSFVDVVDGQAGTKAARGTNNNWIYSKKLIPIDFDKAYRVSCWARKAAGASGTFYLAVKLTDINGNDIAGDGTWWYYAAQGVSGSTSWTKYQGFFGKNTTKPFPSNARFMQVGLVLNYNSSVDYHEAQDARITEVISADLFLANDIIINNSAQIGEAVIDAASIDTLDLSRGIVGQLDAQHINADFATMGELQVVGKNLCPDAAFRGVKFGQTTVNITGQTIGDWYAGAYGAGFVGQLHKQSGIYLKDGSNGFILRCGNTESASIISSYLKIKSSINYYISAYGITPDGSTYGLNYYSRLVWYDENQNFISETNITKNYNFPTLTRFGISATAPSNAAFCKILFSLDYSNNKRLIISAVQLEEGTAATAWVNGEQGQVTADRVVTGLMKSLNYSTTQGSSFDLDNGNFKMGGSANPIFEFDVATLTGKLSGFTFNSTDLTAGTSTNAIGISTDAAKPAFWAGDETPADAPFRIEKDGTGKIGSLGISNAGFGSTSTYTTSSVSHGIHIVTQPIDSVVNLFDMPAPGIDLVSYTMGPYLQTRVRISASDYYYGGSYTLAPIQVSLSNNGMTAFSTNGKVNALSGFTQLSDKERKTNFQEIEVLEKLSEIEIKKYQHDHEILSLDFEVDQAAAVSPTCIANANKIRGQFLKNRSEIVYEHEKLELYERSGSKKLNELTTKELALLSKIEQIKQKRAQSIIKRKKLSDKRKQLLEEKRTGKRKGQAEKNAPFYINAMAGQFNKAFGVSNETKKSITLSDQIGVALRAIQELNELRKAEKKQFEERIAALEAIINKEL